VLRDQAETRRHCEKFRGEWLLKLLRVHMSQSRRTLNLLGDVGPCTKADIAPAAVWWWEHARLKSTNSNYFASVLVLRLRTTPLYDITHVVEYKGRECPHALPLFGTKRFVEWLPRLGEFIQIG
jgi:hypothetical protein